MLSHLLADEIILYFIKKKLWTLESILVGDFAFPKGYKQAVVALISSCYTFLIFFCKFNPDNQSKLHSNLEQIFQCCKYDVGQIELLCAVYEDNKTICRQFYKDTSILETLENLIKSEGRQRRFLKFYRTVIECECSAQVNNVYIIMNQLLPQKKHLSDDWHNLDLLYLKELEEDNNLEFDIGMNDFISKDRDPLKYLVNLQKGENTYKDEPILYHTEVMELLTCMVQSTSLNLVKSKIKKILSLPYLLSLLEFDDCFTEEDKT